MRWRLVRVYRPSLIARLLPAGSMAPYEAAARILRLCLNSNIFMVHGEGEKKNARKLPAARGREGHAPHHRRRGLKPSTRRRKGKGAQTHRPRYEMVKVTPKRCSTPSTRRNKRTPQVSVVSSSDYRTTLEGGLVETRSGSPSSSKSPKFGVASALLNSVHILIVLFNFDGRSGGSRRAQVPHVFPEAPQKLKS